MPVLNCKLRDIKNNRAQTFLLPCQFQKEIWIGCSVCEFMFIEVRCHVITITSSDGKTFAFMTQQRSLELRRGKET